MTIKDNSSAGFGSDSETAKTETKVMPPAEAWIRRAFEDALLKARASELWATPPITKDEKDAFNALSRREKEDVLNRMLDRVNYFINDRDMLRQQALEADQSVRRGAFRVSVISIND